MDNNNRSSVWPNILTLTLLACVLALLIFRFWPFGNSSKPAGADPTAESRPITPRGDLGEDEKSTIAIFERCAPSVVHITSLALYRDRFSLSTQQIPKGTGSGFVWDEKGRIVTNYHVVRDATAIEVTLADHSTWSVTQVQVDEDKDLAVLWTNAPADHLKPLKLGTSADLKVGQKVFAIGNPFGLDQTLTTGIISALGREIESENRRTIKGVIQTDAAINPGNSGGPLLDSAGRLIGVNTAIISPSGSSAGIGFAIPVDEVNRVIPRLVRFEKNQKPGLGIVEAPAHLLKRRGMTGVMILDVESGGPAQKAGLKPTRRDERGHIRWGDVIVGIDGKKIRNANELYTLLEESYEIGKTVRVSVWRDGNTFDVEMVLTADKR